MKRILIPTDFSENSKNAIRYALDLFESTAIRFYLLFVNIDGSEYREKPVYTFGTNIIVEKEHKAIRQKLADLEKFSSTIPSKRVHHHFSVLYEDGYFLDSIRKQIREKNVDMIVMGTRGASELKEFFTGTHAGDVITKVACDVLVVPDNARYHGFNSVVFPIDFELEYSERIIETLREVIGQGNVPLRLLYITKSQLPLFETVKAKQKRLVQRLSKALPNPVSFHRTVARKVEDGVRIFADSVKADLIIMISKDHGLIHRLFLDTTVEEVSFETEIPLLSLQG